MPKGPVIHWSKTSMWAREKISWIITQIPFGKLEENAVSTGCMLCVSVVENPQA